MDFNVSVDLRSVFKPNSAPLIQNKIANLTVEAGIVTTETVGYPVDRELDRFKILSLTTNPISARNWVSIRKESMTEFTHESLEVTFDVPMATKASNFTLIVVL